MRISKSTLVSLFALLCILVGIPLALLYHEAHRTGQPLGDYLKRSIGKMTGKKSKGPISTFQPTPSGPAIMFLDPIPIGDALGDTKPWISHLIVVDLDQDGLKDVVACDAKANEIRWVRQKPARHIQRNRIGEEVRGPAHVTPCDMDGDGDLDLLVAKMGMIFPNNDKIGAVVVMENFGQGTIQEPGPHGTHRQGDGCGAGRLRRGW